MRNAELYLPLELDEVRFTADFLKVLLLCIFLAAYSNASESKHSAVSQANFAASPYDQLEHVHVDVNTGSDDNTGTQEAPLQTLEEGMARAISNRSKGLGTRILLYPGTYREGIEHHYNHSGGPLIVIEAVEPHAVVISGSDIFSDWACDVVCEHHWPHDWGYTDNSRLNPLGNRREMVFVDGVRQEQVLRYSDLAPGKFYVDESADRLYLHPERSLSDAMVEVAVRPHLFYAQALHDLEIRNLVFQHAATPVDWAAVFIVEQSNVLIENILVQHNNWDGLAYYANNNITLRNSTMNHNGGNGMQASKVVDGHFEGNETSYNNWRGHVGGMSGWSVGQKFMRVRDVTIRRHTSTNNLSRGLWLDWDNSRVVLDEVYSCNNLLDGLFIEASQGPIAVRNSTFCGNGQAGIVVATSHNLTIEESSLSRNSQGQLRIVGTNVEVENWITNETYLLSFKNWRVQNNRMAAKREQSIISTTIDPNGWQLLMSTSEFNSATYSAEIMETFQVPGNNWLTFKEWQKTTGQDEHSVFEYLPTSVAPRELHSVCARRPTPSGAG